MVELLVKVSCPSIRDSLKDKQENYKNKILMLDKQILLHEIH